MHGLLRPVALAGVVFLGGAHHAAAQSDFHWRGQVPPGQSIEVKGINGEVRAVPSTTNDVEVTAVRSARRSNPADVRFEVVPHAGGVTICAVYPDVAGQGSNECLPGGRGRSNNRNNDTSVEFTVRVPPGVGFIGRTVNGQVDAEALQGNAEGYTVNGSVRLSTTELARATTVNGSITASMGRADWPDGARFSTVNGGITLNIQGGLNAELRAETVSGNITADFPITVTGELNRRELRGTVGAGGPPLRLSTVNGSIRLTNGQ